jgi:hypothetical protein
MLFVDMIEELEKKKRPRSVFPTHTYGWEVVQFFNCLQLSNAYRLATKEATEGLTEEEIKLLPKDFDEVRACFQKFGDVSKEHVSIWWYRIGRHWLSGKYATPSVRTLWTFDTNIGVNDDPTALKTISEAISAYRSKVEGNLNAVVLYIPICLHRAQIHRQVDEVLRDFSVDEKDFSDEPQIRFLNKKKISTNQIQKYFSLFDVLRQYPDYPNWRIGAKARFSKKLSTSIGLPPKPPSSELHRINRELLGKIVSRAFKKCERIVENAARGRFPDDSSVDLSGTSYKEMAKRVNLSSKMGNVGGNSKIQEYKEIIKQSTIHFKA